MEDKCYFLLTCLTQMWGKFKAWHTCKTRVKDRGANATLTAQRRVRLQGSYRTWFVLQGQDRKTHPAVVPRWCIASTHFWALKDTEIMQDGFWIPRRWRFQTSWDCRAGTRCKEQIPGWLRDVPNSMTWQGLCALGHAVKELPSSWPLSDSHTSPQVFSGMRKLSSGYFSASFSS